MTADQREFYAGCFLAFLVLLLVGWLAFQAVKPIDTTQPPTPAVYEHPDPYKEEP